MELSINIPGADLLVLLDRCTIFVDKQLLSGRIDVRADGVLGDTSDVGPLGDCVALGLLNDGPVDGFVERAIAGHQLGDPFEEVLLFPDERDVFEPMVLPIVDGEHLDGAVALQVGSNVSRQRLQSGLRERIRGNVVERSDIEWGQFSM